MGPTTTYLAILGDVVGSRHVEDRENLRLKLRDGLRVIEGQPSLSRALAARSEPPVLAAGPEISAGDEVQVLLRAGALPGRPAIDILDLLTTKLRPYRMAFGLGIGTLATGIDGDASVQELDGNCFHRAREALARAKSRRRWAVVIADPDHSAPNVATLERAANAILRLTGDIRSGWTDRQTEVMEKLEETPLQKDVARELDVSPSVISEVLRAARRDAVHEADLAVASLLNHMALPAGEFRPPTEQRP